MNKRKQKSRKIAQPNTNAGYWKRQLPDLFDADDRDQYSLFGGFVLPESDTLSRLLSRPIIAKAIESGALKIINADDLSLDDYEADE